MIRSTAVFVVFCLTASFAQNAAAPPDPAPLKLLKSWLESFNAGDLAKHADFITAHESRENLQGLPPIEMAEREMRFRDSVGGGFDIYKVEESGDTKGKAILKERGGLGWAEVAIGVDPQKPDVIARTDFRTIPPPADMQPAREDDAALARDVGAVVRKQADEDRFSGVVLIARNGKPFFQESYNLADRRKKIPNDANTRFNLGSMNKMFTAVAIAQLVQAGKLKFSDTIAQALPDYPDKETAARVTIAQLLTHSSGMGDFFGSGFDMIQERVHSVDDYLPAVVGKPLLFEPGSRWAYSNAGFIVLGLIIEKASGQDYFDYVQEHIFKPAGMNDSGTWEKNKLPPDYAIGYMREDQQWDPNFDSLPMRGSSTGGGASTAPDLLRFDQALRSHKLLSAQMTDTVISPKIDIPNQKDKYGYGFFIAGVDGKRVVGHGGGAPGLNGNLDMYWDSGYTVIVLSNFDPPLAQKINNYIRERIRQ
jgi:CubicO group peptidase (beta-lactamase class C family)